MKYSHVVDKPDYSDFASGKVLFGLPGQVATPLRLVDELFQSGLAFLRTAGLSGRITLYDPCCGTAYHLAALAYLHWSSISTILASDINADVLAIAKRNLSLLTLEGISQRIAATQQSYEAFGKNSHREALEAARRFRSIRESSAPHEIETVAFDVDAFNQLALFDNIHHHEVTMVLSDLPYGQGSRWRTAWLEDGRDISDSQLAMHLLNALVPVLLPKAVICLLIPKTVKISHNGFRRIRQFRVGKRLGIILQQAG